MYCPKCGSNNHEGTRFCARCGTNIEVVTDAIAGRAGGPSPLDERMMKLLKDYHKGRRDAITGAILIPAGLMVMSIMIAAGLSPIAAFFIICWMFFWGVSALADGVGKWMGSSGEMKQLGLISPPAVSQLSQQTGNTPSTEYSTGPIDYPGSVTEQTTRKLDERGYKPPLGSKSNQ